MSGIILLYCHGSENFNWWVCKLAYHLTWVPLKYIGIAIANGIIITILLIDTSPLADEVVDSGTTVNMTITFKAFNTTSVRIVGRCAVVLVRDNYLVLVLFSWLGSLFMLVVRCYIYLKYFRVYLF